MQFKINLEPHSLKKLKKVNLTQIVTTLTNDPFESIHKKGEQTARFSSLIKTTPVPKIEMSS